MVQIFFNANCNCTCKNCQSIEAHRVSKTRNDKKTLKIQRLYLGLAFDHDQIAGNMRRSRAIRHRPDHVHCWSHSVILLYKLPLTRHLATVIICTVLYGREDGSGRSISSQLCSVKGEQEVPMHGAAVGSCREEKVRCIILPD